MLYSSLYPATHASTEGLSRNTFFRMLSSGVSLKACVPTTHLMLLGHMIFVYTSSGFCFHREVSSRASLIKDSMSWKPKLCLACCWLAAFNTCVSSASIPINCWRQCGWVPNESIAGGVGTVSIFSAQRLVSRNPFAHNGGVSSTSVSFIHSFERGGKRKLDLTRSLCTSTSSV